MRYTGSGDEKKGCLHRKEGEGVMGAGEEEGRNTEDDR